MVLPGYLSANFARSLAEYGTPRFLPRSQGWLIERSIDGRPERDAMGCYPLFSCVSWSKLADDLADIGSDLVSVVLVTDPFGAYDAGLLADTFNRGAIPFKQHHVLKLADAPSIISAHHRRNARKALKAVRIERLVDPTACLDDWCRLYATLVSRHSIRGVAAFSRESFALQLDTPGMVVFRASAEDVTVGMLLWYVQNSVGYYHLGAYDDRGYELGASFALFSFAIDSFSPELEWICLGAGAGVSSDGGGGLDRFKAGWASDVRTAYLCRHVGNAAAYSEIVESRGAAGAAYFPAYRQGEFA